MFFLGKVATKAQQYGDNRELFFIWGRTTALAERGEAKISAFVVRRTKRFIFTWGHWSSKIGPSGACRSLPQLAVLEREEGKKVRLFERSIEVGERSSTRIQTRKIACTWFWRYRLPHRHCWGRTILFSVSSMICGTFESTSEARNDSKISFLAPTMCKGLWRCSRRPGVKRNFWLQAMRACTE